MRQTPPGKKRILLVDGRVVDEFGNEVGKADLKASSPTPPVAQVFAPPGKDREPGKMPTEVANFLENTPAGMLRGASVVTSMIPGAGAVPTALRTGLPILLSTGAEAVKGGNVKDTALEESAFSVGGEAAGRGIPKITTPFALAFGGAVGRNLPFQFRKAVAAFNDYASRFYRPTLVGRGEKGALSSIIPDTETLGEQWGKRLQAAEEASPAQFNLTDVKVDRPTTPTRFPADRTKITEKFNYDTLMQQAEDYAVRVMGMPQVDWDNLSWARKMQIANQVKLSTRQVGELQRGASKEAKQVTSAIQSGEPPYMAEDKSQLAKGLQEKLREWRHGPADVGTTSRSLVETILDRSPKPGQPGAIKFADRMKSDLTTMQAANDVMRSGGIIGDPGLYAMRGALGSGAALMTGQNPGLGFLLGLTLLNPTAISGTGFLGSRAAMTAPALWRLSEAVEDFQNDPTGVRRRKPQG